MLVITIANQDHSNMRLDNFLSQHQDIRISRSYIQELIKAGKILVNNKPAKSSHKLKIGEEVSIDIPPPKELNIEPENIPLDIVYEDDEFMVINKAVGMVTHPAPGAYSGTLVNALLFHTQNLSNIAETIYRAPGVGLDQGISERGTGVYSSVNEDSERGNNAEISQSRKSYVNGVCRPGIVHRLDKDTSGLMVVAKTDAAHLSLAQQIQDRTLERRYLCLVHGNVKGDKGVIDKPIGRHPKDRQKMAVIDNLNKAKTARTHWFVKQRFAIQQHATNINKQSAIDYQYSLIECKLETGRTHQIRVHMSWFKHPIVGDVTYGAPAKTSFNGLIKVSRPLLHSYKLSLTHPTGSKRLDFEIPLASDFQEVLDSLAENL